jgi:hypothetical protein
MLPSPSAPDCPVRGHRVNGAPCRSRRMRSATPAIDPAATPTEFGACKGDGQNQVLSRVLKSGSARRGVAPTPLARRPCEETSPIALPASGALGALVAIRHLDLAPVVRSNQATPVFSHDRASPRCCGAVQDPGVKPGCRTCADRMELPARGSRRPDPRPVTPPGGWSP